MNAENLIPQTFSLENMVSVAVGLNSKKTILVVDDTPTNITMASAALRSDYRLKVATNGKKALELAQMPGDTPDLILLDVLMPEMDGYEVCRQLKANPMTAKIPVIFLTAQHTVEEEIYGLSIGAADYIHKPFVPQIMKMRVHNQLLVKQANDFMRDQNNVLERLVDARTQELLSTQDVLIMALSALAETRDNDTGNHLRRTQTYVQILVDELSMHPDYAPYFETLQPRLLFKLAPLHDIGKVGVPDSILLKPGSLTPEEFAFMKKHPLMGGDAISHAQEQLGSKFDFLEVARDIVAFHHEKWDGTGYPFGKKGDDIPISARLMAIADVYDALICKRVYKPAFSQEETMEIIRKGVGTQFDPEVFLAFEKKQGEFMDTARQFSDD